jgi:PAS domain S-box-containing protein
MDTSSPNSILTPDLDTLRAENAALRAALDEAQDTLAAIRAGDVDALVIQTSKGPRVFTLQGADHAYRALVEQMAEGALTLTADGLIHYANSSFAKLLQRPLELLIGEPVSRFLHDSHRPLFESLLRQAHTQEVRDEITFLAPDGAPIPTQVALAPLVQDNPFAVVSAVVSDLTEHKRTQKVFTSEEMHRVFFDLASVGMVYVNPDGTLAKVNQAYCEITGYPAEELIGMPVLNLTHPDDRQHEAQRFIPYLHDQRTDYSAAEKRYLRKDGSVRWVSVIARLVHDDQGRPRFSIGVIEDITDRKLAQQALAASEERFRSVLDHSHDIIYRMNLRTSRFEYVSPSIMKVGGFTPEEVLAMTLQQVHATIHPDDLPGLRAAVAALDHTPTVAVEYRERNKAGEYRWLSNHITLIRDDAGQPLYRDGSIRDITDRKNSETTLETTVRRFHNILSHMYPAVLLMTNDGHIEYVNHPFCREFGLTEAPADLLGLSTEDIIGKTKNAYAHPEDAATRIREILAHGAPVRGEEVTLRDGRTCLRDFVPLQVDNQTYGHIWVQTDITERKLADNALRQSEAHRQVAQAIETERQRLDSVLDLLPAYVVLLTPDHHIRFANRFFEDRFGKAERRHCFQHLFNSAQPCPHCEAFTPFQTRQPHHWNHVCADGRHYEIHDYPFSDADGSNLILEVGIDITETINAQAALQQLNDTLEKRVAERTAELLQVNTELIRFNRAAVNRELRMIELKRQVNRLCIQAGQLPPYTIAPEEVP